MIMGMNGAPSDWAISPADRQLYDSYFAQLRSRDGFIDSQTARDFFSKSQLPKNVLANMWTQADRNVDGRLDRQEFFTAMHIIKTTTQAQHLRTPNGSMLPRYPTTPVDSNGRNGGQRRSWAVPSTQEVVPPVPWDFSRYAMTSPSRQLYPATSSVFPVPVPQPFPTVRPQQMHPSGSQSSFLTQPTLAWPSKAQVPVRFSQPKTTFTPKKSKYFVRLKRKELQELKTSFEAVRREKPKADAQATEADRRKYKAASSVSTAKKIVLQTEESIEQILRQGGVIQSANVLLERQITQLKESIRNERDYREPDDLIGVKDRSEELMEVDNWISQVQRRQKRLANDVAEGMTKMSRLEVMLAEKERRLNGLIYKFENLHRNHERLLDQYDTKQLALHRHSSFSLQDPVDSSVPSTPMFPPSSPEPIQPMTALATFMGSSENELSFEQNDVLDILEKHEHGWWLARDPTGHVGHVPASFFQESQISPSPELYSQAVEYAVALYDYTAQNSDELSFTVDDVIEVLPTHDADQDWFLGKIVGSHSMGLVPANYLRFDSQDDVIDDGKSERQVNGSDNDPIRKKAVEELIDTEEKYLADITAVMEIFYAKLRASGVLPETALQSIFFVWPELINSATSFLSVLRNPSKVGFSNLTSSVGGILCQHFPHQGPYITFCSNQVKISEIIREKTAENTRLDEILRSCSQEIRLQGLPLTAAYVKPMQRITRYPLLIKRILDLTPEKHPDHGFLRQALSRAEDLCRIVNENVREAENAERFVWLEKHVALEEFSEKIKFNSATNFLGPRCLLYSGSLIKVKGGREMVAFLFNDFLLFTTPPKAGATSSFGNFSFDKRQWTSLSPFKVYRNPCLLFGCVISASPDGASFQVNFPTASITYNLKSVTVNETKSWMRKIQDAAAEYAKKDQISMWRQMTISQPPVVGCCRVIVVEAVELAGNHDTFCHVTLSEQEKKTKVIGKSANPKWDQSMTFNVHNLQSDVLTLTVYSYNPYALNRFLGRAELHLGNVLMETKGIHVPVIKRLLLSGVASGEVVVKLDIQMFL